MPSCLSFSNFLRSEDFPFPLPGRLEFCLERTDIRELVDFCDGVGEGGVVSFAVLTGSAADGTGTTLPVGCSAVLGRASIVVDSGATTFVFDAPQPMANRMKGAAKVKKSIRTECSDVTQPTRKTI